MSSKGHPEREVARGAGFGKRRFERGTGLATPVTRPGDDRRRSHRTLGDVESSTSDDSVVADLVRRAQQREELAFAELYIRFFDPVNRYLAIALKNLDDAQEVAQEVFARALKAIDRYDPKLGTFRDWLFTLVRNVAIDHLRKGSRAELVELSRVPSHALPVADRAASLLERLDPDEGLRRMLDELPEMQRRVLALRFLFGLTTAEIADVVGATAASVRQIQHRALKALASSMSVLELAGR